MALSRPGPVAEMRRGKPPEGRFQAPGVALPLDEGAERGDAVADEVVSLSQDGEVKMWVVLGQLRDHGHWGSFQRFLILKHLELALNSKIDVRSRGEIPQNAIS